MRKKTSIFWTIPLDELIKVLDSSASMADVMRHFNLSIYGSNHLTLKERLHHESVDLGPYKEKWSKLHQYKLSTYRSNKSPIEDFTVENSSCARTYFKKRLIKEGLLKAQCNNCGLIDWLNQPLSLDLHHINGVPNDNRLENLCLLCPNCHRQTENYAGKSSSKKIKPSVIDSSWRNRPREKSRKVTRPKTKEELELIIKEHGYVGTGKLFGVSDNAIRKWLKHY